jgi:hypothetical protein
MLKLTLEQYKPKVDEQGYVGQINNVALLEVVVDETKENAGPKLMDFLKVAVEGSQLWANVATGELVELPADRFSSSASSSASAPAP